MRKNPDLLKQFGLDPKILDSIGKPIKQDPQSSTHNLNNLTENLVKQTIKDQLTNIIKPFLNFIPLILTGLLFITLESLVSLITIFIYPILIITFLIMEKTRFISFTEEMRPVKKMVI